MTRTVAVSHDHNREQRPPSLRRHSHDHSARLSRGSGWFPRAWMVRSMDLCLDRTGFGWHMQMGRHHAVCTVLSRLYVHILHNSSLPGLLEEWVRARVRSRRGSGEVTCGWPGWPGLPWMA